MPTVIPGTQFQFEKTPFRSINDATRSFAGDF